MMSIVKLISDKLNSSIEKKGSGSLVVSGGSSPISIYEELSNIDLSWSKVFLTLVDDRLVDPCLLYTSPSPRDPKTSRMPSSA